ncbi:MAG: hypothetical protein GYB66_09500, partial [Chloroflexi bacterium]|nr:hypothetical protein [Chloroflexota bacterium]
MKWLLKKLTSRFNKDQVGQSIVLLAFAFIALAAFVGLVTDISVLFVRYSNLRRTIDAAAIAAAGQIREGTDYGTVALTAREFIQLHGLEPHRVWVETCETDIKNWREGKDQWEGNPHPEGSFPDPSAMGNTELCKWDNPRKLVRVRAQIESETFFLRLLGFDTITLEASSVSETAVLDVALVLDTSQSMSGATQLSHYDAIGYDIYGTQPTKPQFRASCQNDQFDGATDVGPFEEVQYYQPFGQTSTLSPPTINVDRSMYQWGPCCNDPGNGSIYQDIDGTWKIFVDYNGNGTRDGGEPLGVTSSVADNDYSDLICHPFRDVKDSARNFIKRLDYVRGDRVAIITFDTDADIKLPNTMPEWPEDDVMLTDETLALDVLNGQVGVNENAYEDIDGGGWGKC